jgi:hypothetical protein
MSRLHLLRRKKPPASPSWEPTPIPGTNGRRYLEDQPYALPKDNQEEELRGGNYGLYQ